MSYDRVLPNPVALRYETTQVTPRSSNLLDHKIMNDLPQSVTMHTNPSSRYDARSTGVSKIHQHMSMKLPDSKMGKPVGPILTTKELPLRERSDRSSSSSVSSGNSPVKSKEGAMQFCLCQPDPKIPRPRNGESIMSAPSLQLGKCNFRLFPFWSSWPGLICRAQCGHD
jgi:HMG box factor